MQQMLSFKNAPNVFDFSAAFDTTDHSNLLERQEMTSGISVLLLGGSNHTDPGIHSQFL